MKIDVDFSQLKKTAARIARKESDFAVSLDQYRFTEVDTLLEEGIDVGIEELDFSTGIASYKGRQVLLYIPDHGSSLDKVIKDPTQGRSGHPTPFEGTGPAERGEEHPHRGSLPCPDADAPYRAPSGLGRSPGGHR